MPQPIQKDETLTRDLANAENDADQLHIWWLGGSGFLLKHAGRFLILDPHLSSDTSLVDPSSLGLVSVAAITQEDEGQFDPETLIAIKRATAGDLRLVIPYGIRNTSSDAMAKDPPELLYVDERLSVSADGFNLTGVAASPGEIRRDTLGRCQTLGYVITVGDFRIFHCSETTWYMGLGRSLQPLGGFDVMLLPVSDAPAEQALATNLTADEAASLAKTCGCGIAVPCRHDEGADGSQLAEAFSAACERTGQDHEALRLGERLTIERARAEPAPEAPAEEEVNDEKEPSEKADS